MHTFIGHRGICNQAPENTDIGFEMCAKYFHWVEFDATLTADEQVVVFHDRNLLRLTNTPGIIGEKTLAELSHITVQGRPIPSLQQTIMHLQELNLNMNLEIKVNDDRWEILTDRVIDIVRETYTNKTDLLFSSFNHNALCRLRDAMPNATIGHLFNKDIADWQNKAKKVHAKTVNISKNVITEDIVKSAKDLGYGVYVFTVNNKDEYDKLMAWGIDGVFTDEKPSLFT